ncbi:TPA: DUF551 domain-containing protein [Escherichia coli]|nr:DUF551 domain-containing protein [Escherichia coli]
MTKFTKEQLIEDLKSSTQNASGMFEISEDTICAVMYMLTTPPSPASVPGEIQKLKDGRGFKYVKDGVLYSVNYANGWNQCRSAMLQAGNFRENKDSSTNNFRETSETSTNSPVTPDGWISCSERMPAQDDWILIYSKHGEYMAGQVQGEYVELSDGTLSWLGNALFWMPLPEPPQHDGE